MSECPSCAACDACDGSCGVCPYADQTKHYHQRAYPGGGYIGENNGPRRPDPTVEDVLRAWMKSPLHHQNIPGPPGFKTLGVGILASGDWWVNPS